MTRRLRKIFSVFFLLILTGLPCANAALPQTKMKVVDHDPFGIWQKKSKDFKRAKEQGAKIVFMPEEKTFFAYWAPPHFKSGRIIVSIHGTGGNPYIALRDEIADAEKFDYMIVALSWFSPERGFFQGEDLYRNILQVLSYLRSETGNDLSRVAYIGFSRGAAVSYEVAYLDSISENIFDLMISHSGGIPLDLRTEALKPDSEPNPFFTKLVSGELGNAVFKGKKFFLYSGDKDESWGLTMSLQLEYAKRLIEANQGQVLEWVRDPEGGHLGFIRTPVIKEKALRYFIELTPR